MGVGLVSVAEDRELMELERRCWCELKPDSDVGLSVAEYAMLLEAMFVYIESSLS